MNVKIDPDGFLATAPVLNSVLYQFLLFLLIHLRDILFLLSSLSRRVFILSLFASYISSWFIRVVYFFKGLGIIERFLNIYCAEFIFLVNSKGQEIQS